MYGLIEKIIAESGKRSVQKAIALGRPLIAGFGERFETIPMTISGKTRA
jgi:hypothetical protein